MKKWTRPQNYMGAEWPEYYVFISQTRDSGVLDRANFIAAKHALETVCEECEDSWLIVRESHWLCGWIEWIAVHENAVDCIEIAEKVLRELEDYPIIDEELFCQMEYDESCDVWLNCFTPKDRIQFLRERGHIAQNFEELIQTVRGKTMCAIDEYSELVD